MDVNSSLILEDKKVRLKNRWVVCDFRVQVEHRAVEVHRQNVVTGDWKHSEQGLGDLGHLGSSGFWSIYRYL